MRRAPAAARRQPRHVRLCRALRAHAAAHAAAFGGCAWDPLHMLLTHAARSWHASAACRPLPACLLPATTQHTPPFSPYAACRYDIGATSGALVSMTSQQWSGTDWYSLSAFQSGLVVSLSLAGALLGSGALLRRGRLLRRAASFWPVLPAAAAGPAWMLCRPAGPAMAAATVLLVFCNTAWPRRGGAAVRRQARPAEGAAACVRAVR